MLITWLSHFPLQGFHQGRGKSMIQPFYLVTLTTSFADGCCWKDQSILTWWSCEWWLEWGYDISGPVPDRGQQRSKPRRWQNCVCMCAFSHVFVLVHMCSGSSESSLRMSPGKCLEHLPVVRPLLTQNSGVHRAGHLVQLFKYRCRNMQGPLFPGKQERCPQDAIKGFTGSKHPTLWQKVRPG